MQVENFAPEKTDYTKMKMINDKIWLFTTEKSARDKKSGIAAFSGCFFFVQKCDILLSIKNNN